MTAGESVFQGREGTGLAQILRWQDYQPQRPLIDPVRMRNQELNARRQRDAQITRMREIPNEADSHYKETLQREIGGFQQEFEDLTLNKGVPPVEAMSQIGNKLGEIKRRAAKSQAIRADYETVTKANDENKYSDKEWFGAMAMQKAFPLDRDPDKADIQGLQSLVAHPRNFQVEPYLTDFIKPFQKAINTKRIDPEMLNTPLGQFFKQINGSARFAYQDEQGNWVPGVSEDLVTQVLNSDDRISDRVRWDISSEIVKQQKEKEGIPFNEELDYDDIEDQFLQIKDDKNYASQVRGKVREFLEKANQIRDEEDVKSAGRWPRQSDSEGSGFDMGDFSVVRGDLKVNNLSTARETGIIGRRGGEVSIEIPEFQKLTDVDPERPGTPMQLTKIFIDPETGDRAARFIDKYGQVFERPLDAELSSRLNNTKKSPQSARVFNKVVNEAKKLKAEDSYFDDQTFTKDADVLQDLIYKTGREVPNNKEDQKKYISQLTDWLKKRGVEPDISFKENWWNPDITINGEKFDTAKPVDRQRLEELLFKNTKGHYSTDKKPAGKAKAEPKFDPNDPL